MEQKLTLNTKMENAVDPNKLVFLQDKIYGNVLYYPDSPAAIAIVSIAGRKTLEWKHLQKLDDAGFEIEVKNRY